MHTRSRLAPSATTALVGAGLLLLTQFAQAAETETSVYITVPARTGDFALKVEPGVALALTHPQS